MNIEKIVCKNNIENNNKESDGYIISFKKYWIIMNEWSVKVVPNLNGTWNSSLKI